MKTLYISWDSKNATHDVMTESGACLFYSTDPQAVTDWLEMIGATTTNYLTWKVTDDAFSKITNGQ